MKAAVFEGPGKICLREKRIPEVAPGTALLKVTTTTICGTDIHILNGDYPVKTGLTIGHECVGVIAALGEGVTGYEEGQRVICGAITPCGQCSFCLDGQHSQCGGKPLGGWKLGNTMDGCQAEYVLVPSAQANLAVVPEDLSDEEVLLCPDIMSTGFGGAENGNIQLGDTVAIFAQGPIGLCATTGARLKGAARVIVVDENEARLRVSEKMGADFAVNREEMDPVQTILTLTGGRGCDVAIEALGTQDTFQSCLRVLRPGGTLSSLGVYSGKLTLGLDAFSAGLGDHRIVTTLCPGGKERMRRLIELVVSKRFDSKALITHRFGLDQIEEAYRLFAHQRDGVIKVAIKPGRA
jgi:alcohol dehydrogenase